MNDKEYIFFGNMFYMFGETITKILFGIYIGFVQSVRMLGIYLSYPFMFFRFFRQAGKK